MIRGCLAAAMALVIAAPLSAKPAEPLALLDVPFLSQSEALCGGAAAAMVLRYWGERGVAADDFAPLVDHSAGGIRTSALVQSLRTRGWGALELPRAGQQLRQEVARGRPVIALIEDRPGTYHYIVIVGWHERAVVAHDPARAPFRVMAVEEFERRWQAADRWALVVQPPSPAGGDGGNQGGTEVAPRGRRSPSVAGVSGTEAARVGSVCDATVRRGVELAQTNDLPGAEQVLADAAYRCGGAAPLRELAGVRLLQRRWPEVTELAAEALRSDPRDAYAARLLGTSRFVQGDAYGALAAWNIAAEPRVDLVAIDGLHRTRFRIVERYLDLPQGSLLTPSLLQRSRRRVGELPSAQTATIDYVPVEQGRAEARVRLAERPSVPRGLLDVATVGARAAVHREIVWPMASLLGGGELLSASWRFWPDRPRYAVTLAAPFAIGVVDVTAYDERQPFSRADIVPSERSGGSVGLSQWATGRVRWSARAGADRWRRRGTFGALAGDIRVEFARTHVDVGSTVWTGPASFAATRVSGDWRSSDAQTGTRLVAHGSIERIDGSAPMDLWPAGDVGHGRPTLLRAHTVLDGGLLRVDRLGRTLTSASVGIQRWLRPIGPLRAGVEGFVDVARTARRFENGAIADADVGAGLRLALPGIASVFQVNAAQGLRDRHYAVSVLWTAEP